MALLFALAFAAPASAGTYSAVACSPADGALMPETAAFGTNNQGQWSGRGCGDFLTIDALGPATAPGTFGEWTISAPAGLRFQGGRFAGYPHPQASAEYWGQYFYREAGASTLREAGAIRSTGWYEWPTGGGVVAADQFAFRATCIDASGCTGGVTPLSARGFTFWLEDTAPPATTELAGALVEEAAQRGQQAVRVPALDQGSGVRSIELLANGSRVAIQELDCPALVNGAALRLAPCPLAPTSAFAIDTTQPPFREGKNVLQACATDYAQEADDPQTWAERGCGSPTKIYVDNSCDVSQAPDAADIRFGFDRRGSGRRTVRFGKRIRVIGKLTDAADEPIKGATVCVSTRDRVRGASASDIAEVKTNKRGKAKVALPKGASRSVRLTYWADEEDVEMRTVGLNVRARPKLSVISRRKLSDGGRARFRVKLAGPYRAKRKVAVQALAPAGWLDFPGCTGRTSEKGIFRCAYRFREQSGDVKYKFRALAPRQRGYPYLQGRTRPKAVVVRD
jgi:hypothetical protein